ncbi:MAG: radical SAM protein [Candidatus Neomarinimicrobiota bacterium]
MKILLIYPNPKVEYDSLINHPRLASIMAIILKKLYNKLSSTGGYAIPPLGLLVIAANTPLEHEVFFVDERVEEIDFDMDIDLVGISVLTISATRTYEISDRFRKRGIPVILGGIHPSILPHEALEHANSVVIGEVEGIWEGIINDCKNHDLKSIYKAETFHSMENLPIPRFDLLKKGFYISDNIIEIGRGCPFNCSFCSASKFFGNRFRFRPIQDIVNEIKIRNLDNKFILFISDNIFSDKEYAKKLFNALLQLNIEWMSQSSILIAKNNELLQLAARSGCKSLLIGFESLSIQNLKDIKKFHNSNPSDYHSLIKRIHDAGIGITGNFIVGLDEDQTSVFDGILKFVDETKIESPQIGILIPYPGTEIFNYFEKNGRIITKDWDKYYNINSNVVFKPKQMTVNELKKGYCETFLKLYSTLAIIKRLGFTRNFLSFYLPYNLGQNRKSIWLKKNVLQNLND